MPRTLIMTPRMPRSAASVLTICTPYIYRTRDGGKTWQKIIGGLPDDAPIDTVREDPVRKGLLFAGTETSVWVSFDDGDHWQSLQLNLPHTSMRDLWIHEMILIVATHGRSFWVLDDITPLRQIAEKAVAIHAPGSVKPATAYRVRRDTNTDTPLPPDEPLAENPPDGAVIDYYLGEAASGAGDAGNSGCRRQAGAPLLEHGRARNDRGGSEDAGYSGYGGACPSQHLASRGGHASLGLGSARRDARSDAPRDIRFRRFRIVRRGFRKGRSPCPAPTRVKLTVDGS